MQDIKKKVDHIKYREDLDFISAIIGEQFMSSSQLILLHSYRQLTKYQSTNSFTEWEEKQRKLLNAFFKRTTTLVNEERSKALKRVSEGAKGVNLNKYQNAKLLKEVKEGYQDMLNSAINMHKKAIADITSKQVVFTNVGNALSEAVTQHLQNNVDYGIVQYIDGKNYRWENYMEMKVRTELQRDISNNMIASGHELGVVFYIASYFGDCADDHVDLNGAICYDEDYVSMIDDEATLKEVEEYIRSNKLMSVQAAVGAEGGYFTTRPNCRHIFQYISIEDVLGFKSDKDINSYRDDQGLNFNGKYKPEKYEALKEQRHNERQIRKFSERVDMARDDLAKLPKDTPKAERDKLRAYIEKNKALENKYEAKNFKLMKENPHLRENLDRLKHNHMISDFGYERNLEND